jgi:hypothetical protein
MDEYFNGRWGQGTPNPSSSEWRRGEDDRRYQESVARQEQQRAAERTRLEQSQKAWSEALKPAPVRTTWSPTVSPSPAGRHHHAVGRPSASASVRRSQGEVPQAYGGGRSSGGFVSFIFAPFRLVWSLTKFVFKAALIVTLLVVLYAAWRASNAPKSFPSTTSEPSAPLAPPPVFQEPTPSTVEPTVAEPEKTAEEPVAEVPAVEQPAIEQSNRPRIGAEIADVSAADLDRLALAPTQTGAIIRSVVPGSPASDTRLRTDDVVVSINYKAVANRDGFIEAVRSQRSGVRIPIVFLRGGLEYTEDIVPRLE